MKYVIISIALLLACIQSGRTDDVDSSMCDHIRWFDGSHMRGKLLGIQKGHLRWQHDQAKEPWELEGRNIKTIEFFRSKDIKVQLRSLPRITLANGDVWHGKILDLTDGRLTLQHPYAGKLVLPRQAVQRIEGPRKSDWIYEGPSSRSEWELDGGFSYVDDKQAFYADQGGWSITRKFPELPDHVHLHFQLKWFGEPRLKVSFSGDDHRNHLWFEMTGNTFLVDRVINGTYLKEEAKVLMQKEESKFDLYVDRASGKVILQMDNQFVKEWDLEKWLAIQKRVPPSDEKNAWGNISFESSCAMVRLSEVRIGAWDGQLVKSKPRPAEGQDLFVFKNGDEFEGNLRSVSEGMITIETYSSAELSVPLERLLYIALADVSKEPLSFGDEVVRVKWADGSRTRLHAVSVDGDTLQAKHPVMGELKFFRSAVSRLDFHLADERWTPCRESQINRQASVIKRTDK